ncbi:MAG: TMEM165/GDT1 family protein [Actinomycetota bacterium]
MSPSDVAAAFATVFLAELPDKTMVAVIVLVARFGRPGAVWIGATIAFAVHVTVAVTVGSVVGSLSPTAVGIAVFILFAVGSVAMLLAARRPIDLADNSLQEPPTTARRAVVASLVFIGFAEWGDLTQLATAGLAARSDSPASVWLGALFALSAVAAIAATAGRKLVARVPVHRINLVAAALFAALAIWTLVELVTST